jgi:hypothetical protein
VPIQPDTNNSNSIGEGNHSSHWEKLLAPFVWLAGARWSIVQFCPPTEVGRIATIGSTVLVPTILAFFGMYYYASTRSPQSNAIGNASLAAIWAVIILVIDRSLLATYRPFLPWYRKSAQVGFRFLLATIISIAISFPFCLQQFRSAIHFRYQTEYQQLRSRLIGEETKAREAIEREWLDARKAPVQTIANNQQGKTPELVVSEKITQVKKELTAPGFKPQTSAETVGLEQQWQAQLRILEGKRSELQEQQSLEQRLIEASARELRGEPNEYYPDMPKVEGDGTRYKDLSKRRDRVSARVTQINVEINDQSQVVARLEKELAHRRQLDAQTQIHQIDATREQWLEEARRNEQNRGDQLRQAQADLEKIDREHTATIGRHDEHFSPRIANYTRKLEGVLDPMEETIGLYKVIFVLPPDASDIERGELPYKWIAGLIPFAVVFGTLFVLDLVPILSKIFSPPGPYDVLVAEKEFIAETNLLAFRRAYRWRAEKWFEESDLPRGSLLDRQFEPAPSSVGMDSGGGRTRVDEPLFSVTAKFPSEDQPKTEPSIPPKAHVPPDENSVSESPEYKEWAVSQPPLPRAPYS